MALVGVIEAGTVAKVMRSVRHAKADVLILFEREGQLAHVLFDRGDLIMARLGDLTGEQAARALVEWTSGHYSLLKREQKEAETRGHVLLNGLALPARRPLERWLKRSGYSTSIVGYPQHALQVIAYIQPDVVLMHCPLNTMKLSCQDLVGQLKEEMSLPPLAVVIDAPDRPCPEPGADCLRIPCKVERLQEVLDQAWPGTRLGLRQANRERTARIYRPAPLPTESQVADGLAGPAAEPGELSARDLLPLLMVLLVGSALIWGVWWLLSAGGVR